MNPTEGPSASMKSVVDVQGLEPSILKKDIAMPGQTSPILSSDRFR